MKQPVYDKSKLPEVMKIIYDADLLMDNIYENDKAAEKELEKLQNTLREVTGNDQILIRDYKDYQSYTNLETAAKTALMGNPEKEELTNEQIKEIVLNILCHDEAEMNWWLNHLKINTGLQNLTDYIFYPDLVGLNRDSSLEQIAEKIIADREQLLGNSQ